MGDAHTASLFVAELILLIFFGRLFGEMMSRLGQPAIFGQLLGGVVLGPTVFGALFPATYHSIFPNTPELKSMIDAVSQIGILLLLLLTGMEANLSLISRRRFTVISSSVLGIAVPFVLGVMLAYLMPGAVVPKAHTPLVTGLFLGTALGVSSVKIVAIVLIEVGAIRRDLGQLILATAILDDTLAWIIIAIIGGIATRGGVNVTSVGLSLAGTALFLAVALTLGRTIVARIIRWSNDNLTIEVPVVTAILLVTLTMALLTDLIGVHTALGAFLAGVIIGQSPILTEHIQQELRGLVLAFFSPVFFAVAGLSVDLTSLFTPALLLFSGLVILVATIGKFAGAYAGGVLGGLTAKEALALGTGLNARGSTEVIVASIGLSIGALSGQLYTMIVAMAVLTTMAMPISLRWILARVPLRKEEQQRLEKEEAEAQETIPNLERALIYVDASANGSAAARLAGLFVGRRGLAATVIAAAKGEDAKANSEAATEDVQKVARIAQKILKNEAPDELQSQANIAVTELIQAKAADADGLAGETAKGYDIAFVGIADPLNAKTGRFQNSLQQLVEELDGPVLIPLNAERLKETKSPLSLLVPTDGSEQGRVALEVAVALAAANGGSLTALHVLDPKITARLNNEALRGGGSVLAPARGLAKRNKIKIRMMTAVDAQPAMEIKRTMYATGCDVLVLGTALRTGKAKFLNPRTAALVASLKRPVLLVVL